MRNGGHLCLQSLGIIFAQSQLLPQSKRKEKLKEMSTRHKKRAATAYKLLYLKRWTKRQLKLSLRKRSEFISILF